MRSLGDEPRQPREFRRPLRMVERAGQPHGNVRRRTRRAGRSTMRRSIICVGRFTSPVASASPDGPCIARCPATDRRDRSMAGKSSRSNAVVPPPLHRSPPSERRRIRVFHGGAASRADRSRPRVPSLMVNANVSGQCREKRCRAVAAGAEIEHCRSPIRIRRSTGVPVSASLMATPSSRACRASNGGLAAASNTPLPVTVPPSRHAVSCSIRSASSDTAMVAFDVADLGIRSDHDLPAAQCRECLASHAIRQSATAHWIAIRQRQRQRIRADPPTHARSCHHLQRAQVLPASRMPPAVISKSSALNRAGRAAKVRGQRKRSIAQPGWQVRQAQLFRETNGAIRTAVRRDGAASPRPATARRED